jgi:1,4-alpha-glucan branching enzyme
MSATKELSKAPAKPRAQRKSIAAPTPATASPAPSSPPAAPQLRDDPWLADFLPDLDRRAAHAAALRDRLAGPSGSLSSFASGHLHYGLHRTTSGWVFREWAPNASALFLVGDHSNWQELPHCAATRINDHGDWELHLPHDALHHGMHYRLSMHWNGGKGDRIPAWAQRVVQDPSSLIFSAQVWETQPFLWQHPRPVTANRPPLVYECHVGMAQEAAKVGTWQEFELRILPRIAAAGYNTIQIMGVLEHPYYGSFGYHVSSFFAPSSRFGTPEEFKSLVDAAHALGLAVIIDLVHSHAVKNEIEGLSHFDGSPYQYFHDGPRGFHPAWDSRCFDYSKPAVLHFLLSNTRYWIEEFHLDGFRFDGVTSMLYMDHGLGKVFSSYKDYFNPSVDEDALAYLALANELIHSLNPSAITIAEDVSGMPGLVSPASTGGTGFDFRLAMGVPDIWARLASKVEDENWNVEHLYHELTTRRPEEKVIAYVESHDQAIVGGKTLLFRLLDAAIYHGMARSHSDPHTDRGIALTKIARLLTFATAGHGYLNFMGNEFGHPEWIDFPREGNAWSCHYARRQWSLRDDPTLKFSALGDFDQAMLATVGTPALFSHSPHLLDSHVAHQTLIFERGPFLFLFNLHPWNSPVDHPVPCSPGSWQLVLSTDEPRFAGLNRIRPDQSFTSRPVSNGHEILVYLPARSALVLHKSDT